MKPFLADFLLCVAEVVSQNSKDFTLHLTRSRDLFSVVDEMHQLHHFDHFQVVPARPTLKLGVTDSMFEHSLYRLFNQWIQRILVSIWYIL